MLLSTDDNQVCIDVTTKHMVEEKEKTTGRDEEEKDTQDADNNNHKKNRTIHHIPLPRTLCVGQAASRRAQANEVDLAHPLLAHRYQPNSTMLEVSDGSGGSGEDIQAALVMEHGNPSLDCLQSYIDALVELGRMDDGRLGLDFFEEWRANVLVGAGKPVPIKAKSSTASGIDTDNIIEEEADDKDDDDLGVTPPPRKRSRRRSSVSPTTATPAAAAATTTLRFRVKQGPPPPLGSLSLNNCAVAEDTFEAMRDSGMGIHLAVLDLTGIYSLSDPMLEQLLPHCPNLQRLSLKNCRRVTVSSLSIIAQYQTKLQCLDIGGAYNVTPDEVLDTLIIGTPQSSSNATTVARPCPELIELNASGLGWNDSLFKALVDGKHDDMDSENEDHNEEGDGEHHSQQSRQWKSLSVGFSQYLTAVALRKTLSRISATLISLSLHFCETVVDNALMGILGRNLPHVRYLDVRGNKDLNSMTGWYDGRASADFHITMPEMADEAGAAVDDENKEVGDGGQPLTVLARFTGITKASLEDTLRIHPLEAAKLTCILDSGGTGIGIYR